MNDTGISKQSIKEMSFKPEFIYKLSQENFLSDLAKSDGNISIATTVYEMSVYNHGVKVIIHYGLSRNIEAYHHKNGRGGRNAPKLYTVALLHSNFMLKYCCGN